MAAKANQRKWLSMVMPLLLMLGVPWHGFWNSDHSWGALGYCAANFLLLPLVLVVVIAVEQAIVFVTARALGDRVIGTEIGVGPVLFRLRAHGYVATIRAAPIGGFGISVNPRRRFQQLRIATARAVSTGVLIVLLIKLYSLAGRPSGLALKQSLGTHVAVCSLLIIATSFLCLMGAIGVVTSDGANEQRLEMRRSLAFVAAAEDQLRAGAFDGAIATARRGLEELPDDPILLLTLGGALSSRSDDGFEIAESLKQRELLPELKALALNLWAWQCYARGTDDLRAEADTASQQALEAMPKEAPVLDTRGHVLFWNGRLAEAEQFLTRAYRRATSRSTRASSAAGLALVCSARDRHDEALAWLDRARKEDMHHRLIAKAVAAVEPLRRT